MNYFECEKPHCYFVTERYNEFERHRQCCKDESEIIYKQERHEIPDKTVKLELVEEKIIPSIDFANTMFSTYDIESLMLPEDSQSQSNRSIHRIVSIGVATNFGDRREYFMSRQDMLPDSLKFLISQFIAVLEKVQKDMVKLLPQSVRDGYFKYVRFVGSPEYKESAVIIRNMAQKKLSYLRSIISLRSYSWNGEKYDMVLLLGPMLERLALDKEIFKRLKVIKRSGQAYMEIRFGRIIMRDFMNHSMPMSLEKFSKSCGVTEISKATFPYELWSSIQDLEVRTRFPIYDDFQSSLGACQSEDYLEELRFLFEKGLRNGKFNDTFDVEDYFGWPTGFLRNAFSFSNERVLVEDSSELLCHLHTSPSRYAASLDYFRTRCVNMINYLEYYNMLDCKLLILSIEKYAEGFLAEWGINVHECISLPTLAQKLAFKKYDPDAYPLYSFNKKYGFLNAEIRSQLFGGMCMVFHRLQKVRPEPFKENEMFLPKSVYCTPDGSLIKNIELYDFNSLVSRFLRKF